jgi:phospholipase C
VSKAGAAGAGGVAPPSCGFIDPNVPACEACFQKSCCAAAKACAADAVCAACVTSATPLPACQNNVLENAFQTCLQNQCAVGCLGGEAPFDIRAQNRAACAFGPGDETSLSVGPAVPHGDALPFQHVVVLMLENHSFDNYFSHLPQYGVTGVDVAKDTEANLSPATGTNVTRFHETRYCIADTDHEWDTVHQQWNGGLMDGFVETNDLYDIGKGLAPGGARAMGYYTAVDLPFYYWLAKSFAISDRHFSSLLGPTWPNRFFFYGATSWGIVKGLPDGGSAAPLSAPTILDAMATAGRSFRIYRKGLTSFQLAAFEGKYTSTSYSNFKDDVASDNLADLTLIDPEFTFSFSPGDDRHPPSNIQLGQALSSDVLTTLWSNPSVWKKTVLFLVYDEHGGLYDHVPPPTGCHPDGPLAPSDGFTQLGVRVPLLVVSPFVKKGYVGHEVSDHTSVTRFIENRFDLPAMTGRDANAWPLLDFFDFTAPPSPPPTSFPDATPSKAGIAYCAANKKGGTGMP